jgi:hypothetical protein
LASDHGEWPARVVGDSAHGGTPHVPTLIAAVYRRDARGIFPAQGLARTVVTGNRQTRNDDDFMAPALPSDVLTIIDWLVDQANRYGGKLKFNETDGFKLRVT